MSDVGQRADVIRGFVAIGLYAGGASERQAKHWARQHGLPTFKIGRTVCARKNAIDDWLAEREAAARTGGRGKGDG